MWRPVPLWVIGVLAGCGGDDGVAPAEGEGPATAPVAVSPPAPITPAGEASPPPSLGLAAWPRHVLPGAPAGATMQMPTGQELVGFAVDPMRGGALVLTRDMDRDNLQWNRWDFRAPLEPVAGPFDVPRKIVDFAFSPFDGSLFVVSQHGGQHTLDRCAWQPHGLTLDARLLETDDRVADLVTGFVTWNGVERVFFSAAGEDGTQVMSLTRDGLRTYELTSPTGAPTGRTDLALLPGEPGPSGGTGDAPSVLKAAHARPLSIDPSDGSLLWVDGRGVVHERVYEGQNWGEDAILSGEPRWAAHSPNGWLVLTLDRDGTTSVRGPGESEPTPVDVAFQGVPEFSADGRALIGMTLDGLSVIQLDHPMAGARYLSQVPASADAVPILASAGMVTRAPGIHGQLYAQDVKSPRHLPALLTLDAMLEVVQKGVQVVVVRRERDLVVPRFQGMVTALAAASTAAGLDRPKAVAEVAAQVLAGDYAHEEGARILAGLPAESPLFSGVVDYGAFAPAPPYRHDPVLTHYARALQLVNRLELSPEEREALAGDAVLVEAWQAWSVASAALWAGQRDRGVFAQGDTSPAYVQEACLPGFGDGALRRFAVRPWGPDHEILARVVAQEDPAVQAEVCGLPGRRIPSGLDLLAGLGSGEARSLAGPDYARFPALEARHTELLARVGEPLEGATVSAAWLRLIQLLATAGVTPVGVEPTSWRRRLMETALASWVGLRHLGVSVVEGADGPELAPTAGGFEVLETEPGYPVVDPVPAAWEQTARVLDALAVAGDEAGDMGVIAERLRAAAADSRRLGAVAKRQMSGQAVDPDDQAFLADYGRTVARSTRLLAGAAVDSGAVSPAPGPIAKARRIHTWRDPSGEQRHLYAGVGSPRQVTVMLTDRGLQVPATGRVYGYYEIVTNELIGESSWRGLVETAARPVWVNRSQPPPR